MNLENCCVGLFIHVTPRLDRVKSYLSESRGLVYETTYKTVYEFNIAEQHVIRFITKFN